MRVALVALRADGSAARCLAACAHCCVLVSTQKMLGERFEQRDCSLIGILPVLPCHMRSDGCVTRRTRQRSRAMCGGVD